jgi:uncharacterized protein
MQWSLVRIALASAWVVIPAMALGPITRSFKPGSPGRMAMAGVGVAVVLASYAAYVRWIEKRRVSELAVKGAGRELSMGLALGMAVFALSIGILASVGAYRITGQNELSVMLATVPGFVVAAVFEEVLFRAIIFRILESSMGSWNALAVSSLAFGLMHFGNPNAGLLSALAIAIEAGLMLGAAYMLTRRLWLCVAVHFGWNFAQGGIFSVAVSGHAQQGLFEAQMAGAEWLTGGRFGAEGSLVALIVCSVCGVAMLARTVSTDKIVRPSWCAAPA